MYCSVLYGTALQGNMFHCITLHCVAWRGIAVHGTFSALQWYVCRFEDFWPGSAGIHDVQIHPCCRSHSSGDIVKCNYSQPILIKPINPELLDPKPHS